MNKRVETIKNDLTEAQRHAAAAGEAVHRQDIAVLREQEARQVRQKSDAAQAEQAQSHAALEREQLEESIREIDDELEAMQARTGRAEQASATTQEDIARATQQLSDKRQALEQLRAELAERRATEARTSRPNWKMRSATSSALTAAVRSWKARRPFAGVPGGSAASARRKRPPQR